MNTDWQNISGLETIASPGVLLDVDRLNQNLQSMIEMVKGDTSRLRPHVKTHKTPQVTRLQVDLGITKFKVATLAEASMVASNGGQDILLAYQPVGPNLEGLLHLACEYPDVSFATLVDDGQIAHELAGIHAKAGRSIRVFIDVDCGMHRTGIPLGKSLDQLLAEIESLPSLQFSGLHVYDGHLHQPSLAERQSATSEIIGQVKAYEESHQFPAIVGGGGPTFGIWANQTSWECAPGTTVFWDVGYGTNFPDLSFSISIALLTRVISKPGGNRLCLDLGHKSIASEMPLPQRVVIPEIPDAKLIGQSEEHLVLETSRASSIAVGTAFVAFPRHVCPTIALHDRLNLIRGGKATSQNWPVTARGRFLT